MHGGPCGQSNLRGEVRGAAKSVDPQASAGRQLAAAQRAVANDARAQQRRRFDIAEPLGDGVGVILVDHDVLRIPPVDVPTRERRCEAQVLAAE